METASLGDPADGADVGGVVRKTLGAALDTAEMAINRYRVPPGEGLPAGLHAHLDQEEVFVVLAGEAVFETFEGEVTVGEREAVRFAPGEFQSGRNGGDGDLVVLALGAPRDSEDVRIPVTCSNCEHPDRRLDTDDGVTFVCPDCGDESVPAPCPDCGGEDLRVTLGGPGGGDVVVVCRDCEATFDRPPVRG